jgi:pimeloyl-ACP methyl ester carboxylesterase
MFLTGFKSDMTGGKALALEAFCRRRGQAYVRFDYGGHGASSGDFANGTIGGWVDDATQVLDRVAEGPQVLVGSSMGGWIALLLALRRPERIAGFVGVAAAPDFTEELIPKALTPEQAVALERDGAVSIPDCAGGEPYPITRRLLEEGRRHLVLRGRIPVRAPVRLIHGMKDLDVPWQTALRIADAVDSEDVEVQLVKEGGHRLSEPPDLERLCRTVAALLDGLEGTTRG